MIKKADSSHVTLLYFRYPTPNRLDVYKHNILIYPKNDRVDPKTKKHVLKEPTEGDNFIPSMKDPVGANYLEQ